MFGANGNSLSLSLSLSLSPNKHVVSFLWIIHSMKNTKCLSWCIYLYRARMQWMRLTLDSRTETFLYWMVLWQNEEKRAYQIRMQSLFHVMVASNFFYQPVKQEFMSLYILLISHITEIIMSLSYFDWYSQIFISHVAVFC